MSHETSVWAAAHDQLSPFGALERVENGIAVGTPDVCYCLIGVTGWIETKATVASLTLNQVIWAERWTRAGGLCHTLLRADRTWFLYDAAGTRRLWERAEPGPLVRAPGTFPLKEVLRFLAPVERRISIKTAAALMGSVGGNHRRDNLTPERRSEIARLGAKTRWESR